MFLRNVLPQFVIVKFILCLRFLPRITFSFLLCPFFQCFCPQACSMLQTFTIRSVKSELKQTSDFTHPRRSLRLQYSFDILYCIHSSSSLPRFCKQSLKNKAFFSCIHQHLRVEKMYLKRNFDYDLKKQMTCKRVYSQTLKIFSEQLREVLEKFM